MSHTDFTEGTEGKTLNTSHYLPQRFILVYPVYVFNISKAKPDSSLFTLLLAFPSAADFQFST